MNITIKQLASLPPSVRVWLEKSGIVGRKPIAQVDLDQQGQMRLSKTGKWMDFQARQHFTTHPPAFYWDAKVRLTAGIYMHGQDSFASGKGRMSVRLFSLIPLVRAAGDAIDQGAMVRYLAEMIWFPSAALENYISWRPMEGQQAEAIMTYQNCSASGTYQFNNQGDVIRFQAKRYYSQGKSSHLEDWLVEMDPQGYKNFDGIWVPAKASVSWKLATGIFTWLKLEINHIQYL